MLQAFDSVLPDKHIRQFDTIEETELLIALRSDEHSVLQLRMMIIERDDRDLAWANRPPAGPVRFGKDQYGFTWRFGRLLRN